MVDDTGTCDFEPSWWVTRSALSEAGTYTGSQGPKVAKAEVPIKIVYQDCYCFGFAKAWVWPQGM